MIPRSLVLLLLWVALWGEASVANLASGVVVVPLVTWLLAGRGRGRHLVRPLAAASLVGHVAASLVTSSARVVVAVLAPAPRRIVTSVQEVRLEAGSTLVGSVVANLITLTPGTLTLDLDPESMVLSVHVLGEVDPVAFRSQVLDLERRVARALGGEVAR